MRNLKILVTVVDQTKQPLDNVEKRVKRTGKAAKEAGLDFTKFNRTLFATTAFVGTFLKAFSSLSASLDLGADLTRLEGQFERIFGSKGQFFKSISDTTDASIDKMEAMRQGISLGTLGIIRDSKQLAQFVSKAGVAAKMAGKDSAEGIKAFSDFMKDGNVSHLQFLNLISQTNPRLQAMQAILSKAGGVMGTVVTTQARLALGQGLLNNVVKGQLKGFRDLKDIVADVRQNFAWMRSEVGALVGKALAPLLESLNPLLQKFALTLEHLRKNDKQIVFLVKSMTLLTTGAIGLAGALGTLRLATFALTSLGLGLPKLAVVLLGLGSAFVGVTKPVDTFLEKLQLIGAIFKGVYELVTTLDPETGISRLSESTYKLLKKNGLLGFVQFLGRVGSIVKTVTTNLIDAFKWAGKKLDDVFGGITQKLLKIFETFNSPWSNWWVSESIGPVQKGMRAATTILGGFLALWTGKKLLGGLSGALTKLPLVGRLFGKTTGKGPAGTPTDPIYTVPIGGGMGVGGKAGDWGKKIGGMLGLTYLSKKFQDLILSSKYLGEIFTHPAGKLRGLMSVFGMFGRSFLAFGKNMMINLVMIGARIVPALSSMFAGLAPFLGPAIAVAAAGLIGYAIGTGISHLINKYTQGKTDEGFEGSAMERGFFKLSKWTGIGPAQDFIDNQEKQKAAEADALKRINASRAKKGLPPITSIDQLTPKDQGPTGKTDQLFTPISGQQSTASTGQPADTELNALDQLGESLQATPSSESLTMQRQFEAMLNQGKKPSEIAAEQLGTKLDDTNSLLEGILNNTANRPTMQTNPMLKRQ